MPQASSNRTPSILGRLAAALTALALAPAAQASDEIGFNAFIPYVPTPHHVVERMLELAEVGPNDYVIDLGSGDGRILTTAAKTRGARGLGVDIEPRLVQIAAEIAAKEGVADKVAFRVQDLFETPIGEATVVALYLPTIVNIKLRPRLLSELRPGTRVVSHAFSMGSWLADVHDHFTGNDVYLWIIPAVVDGRWDVNAGPHRFEIDLRQHFQEVWGSAVVGGRTVPLHEPRLRGDRLTFAVEIEAGKQALFEGRVAGTRMEAAGRLSTHAWSAGRLSGPAPGAPSPPEK